jgi:hypothetical protein
VREDPSDRAAAICVEDLEGFGVPVGLVFFIRPSKLGRFVAIYPSASGAAEAEISEDAWAAVEAKSALVRSIEGDVEALLVRRGPDGSATVLVVPIDACYELIALLQHRRRGIDGGDDAREAVDSFLGALTQRAEGS